MVEALPQIKVTGYHAGSPATSPSATTDGVQGLKDGGNRSIGSAEALPTSIGSSAPNKLVRNRSGNYTNGAGQSNGPEDRRDSTIDPLSHHILKRTNTENIIPLKLRTGATSEDEPVTPEVESVDASAAPTSSEPITSRGEPGAPNSKDRRKAVSFLSRFIGSKKKDLSSDLIEDAEATLSRTEGTDADVFSQPIGFTPRFPPPPKYIKVRSHGKQEKDFDRMFLAQELRGRTGVEIAQAGGRLVRNGVPPKVQNAKNGNAIWAMEFSKDGRYLAAGGQDHLVRVWAVISTREDRQAHEIDEDAASRDGAQMRLNAPVFKTKSVQEYQGHTSSVLDLSWSKNNFLLSSSMDKTVRLWHVSRTECLCCFKHSDFVTSIQFHPRDDRFFLAGSLDSKLRLWSIPDKSVAFWSQLNDLITAVAFTPDGKTAIAGCLNGLCCFYDTEGLKYQTQIHVRSAHGKNAKGSKITGIQAIHFPPENQNSDVKLLITSNDSRIRVYSLRDKGLEIKFKGNENTCSQIHATFSDDARYVICGSEDRKAFIWSTAPPEKDRDKRPLEFFEAHSAIVTTAIMAPAKTRQLLGLSGDPIYEICNPPPVTLTSRAGSLSSSLPATENDDRPSGSVSSTQAQGAQEFSKTVKPEESPAYMARSSHLNGNIIVTADYMGRIKVFRQDCAHRKRARSDAWETSSTFSKKMLHRSGSVQTRNSKHSRRDSVSSNPPPSDRILSWRQSISTTNSPNSKSRTALPRSVSPQRSTARSSMPSHPRHNSHLGSTAPPTPSISTPSLDSHPTPDPRKPPLSSSSYHPSSVLPISNPDPLMLQGDHSYMYYNADNYRSQAPDDVQNHLAPGSVRDRRSTDTHSSTPSSARGEHALARNQTVSSALSSEEDLHAG